MAGNPRVRDEMGLILFTFTFNRTSVQLRIEEEINQSLLLNLIKCTLMWRFYNPCRVLLLFCFFNERFFGANMI
jgi:hypothetical protein